MVRGMIALALALTAALLASCEAEPTARRPAAAVAESGTVLSGDGTKIAYRAQGEGDTALLFIHGWSCDSSYWDAQIPAFARDHRVVTVDLAGHGASSAERKNWSVRAFGEDVAAVIRAVPDKRIILVGHSMGGPVALEAARLAPDRVVGVIGVDTLADLAGEGMDAKTRQQFLADLRRDTPGTTREIVGSYMFRKDADPALKQRIIDDMASAPPPVAIGAMEALLAYDPKPAAAALSVPVVAINADLQPPMDEAAARKVVPGFRLVTMNGVGHFPQMEAPQRFNLLLREEVARIVRP